MRTAVILIVALLGPPALAQQSIVGEWALSRAACLRSEGVVVIGPKSYENDDGVCRFAGVSRSGDTVTWTGGVCETGGGGTFRMDRLTAILHRSRLSMESSTGGRWGPFVRCR